MKTIFGGAIALILLGLYAYTIAQAISAAMHPVAGHPLGQGYAYTISTVGGLVSALVISQLAITKPGEAPGTRMLGDGTSASTTRVVAIVAILYVVVWLALGLLAFIVGTLNHPNVVQPLTDFGQSWLGLAVAAGYAYFGMTPPTRNAG